MADGVEEDYSLWWHVDATRANVALRTEKAELSEAPTARHIGGGVAIPENVLYRERAGDGRESRQGQERQVCELHDAGARCEAFDRLRDPEGVGARYDSGATEPGARYHEVQREGDELEQHDRHRQVIGLQRKGPPQPVQVSTQPGVVGGAFFGRITVHIQRCGCMRFGRVRPKYGGARDAGDTVDHTELRSALGLERLEDGDRRGGMT